MLSKEFINPHPSGLYQYRDLYPGGVKTIVISGQVGYADGKVGETFEEQADIAHQNIIRELAAAGLRAKDLIKITRVVGFRQHAQQSRAGGKSQAFTREHQPASPWLECRRWR